MGFSRGLNENPGSSHFAQDDDIETSFTRQVCGIFGFDVPICLELLEYGETIKVMDVFGIIEMLVQHGYSYHESVLAFHGVVIVLVSGIGLLFSLFGYPIAFLGNLLLVFAFLKFGLWWFAAPCGIFSAWFLLRLVRGETLSHNQEIRGFAEISRFGHIRNSAVMLGMAFTGFFVHSWVFHWNSFVGMILISFSLLMFFTAGLTYAGLHSSGSTSMIKTVVLLMAIAYLVIASRRSDGLSGLLWLKDSWSKLQYEWEIRSLASSDALKKELGVAFLDPEIATGEVRRILRDLTVERTSGPGFKKAVMNLASWREPIPIKMEEPTSGPSTRLAIMNVGNIPNMVWTTGRLIVLTMHGLFSSVLKQYICAPVGRGGPKEESMPGFFGASGDSQRLFAASLLTVSSLDIVAYSALGAFDLIDMGNVIVFLLCAIFAYAVVIIAMTMKYGSIFRLALGTTATTKDGFQLSREELVRWMDNCVWGDITAIKKAVMFISGGIWFMKFLCCIGCIHSYWTPPLNMLGTAAVALGFSAISITLEMIADGDAERRKRSDLFSTLSLVTLGGGPFSFLQAVKTCITGETRNLSVFEQLPIKGVGM